MSDSADHSPLSTLRGLAADEEASAVVEFIILIPVYLLLFAALWMFTNLAMVRQGLVQASRFQVWSANDPNGYDNFKNRDSFFSPPGEWLTSATGGATATPPERVKKKASWWSAAGTSEDLIKDTDLTGGQSSLQKELAADILSNGGDQTLWKVTGTLSFRYEAPMFGSITQTTQSGVLLPRLSTRAEYDAANGASNGSPAKPEAAHPVMFWNAGSSAGAARKFDPSDPDKMPLSPFYDNDGEFKDKSQPTANEFGIWNTKARIKGNEGDEHDFFDGQEKVLQDP
jgi:hypothetical protein